jgi:hypothetical protein
LLSLSIYRFCRKTSRPGSYLITPSPKLRHHQKGVMRKLRTLTKQYFSQAAPKVSGVLALLAILGGSLPTQASVPLRRADIEQILNRVEVIPRGRSARNARVSDFLSIGDALRTAAASRAELRFNDGSLARVGQRATFHFVPNTRNFRLSNGTMLLLIPPGRGRSTIQTPSAVTGIQGSALVVRHVESRNLTMVMALTNNPAGAMTVTLSDCNAGPECTSEYALRAGEMILVQDGQVEMLAFDLVQFYQTSSLVEGLELTDPNSTLDLGPGINQVREEILDALDQYDPFDDDQSILLNPAMISVTGTDESVADQPWLLNPETNPTNLTAERSLIPLPAGVLAETDSTDDNQLFSSPSNSPAVSNGQSPVSQFPPGVELPSSDGPAPTDEGGSPGESTVEPSPEPSPEPPVVVDMPDSSSEPSVVAPPEPPVVETPEPPVIETPEPPVVETPEPPVVETPEPPVVETPEPSPEPPVTDSPGSVSDGPGQAEPPPFNGFPGQDLPNPSLEDGPGNAEPLPFSNSQ